MFKGWDRYNTLYFFLSAFMFAIGSFTLCNVSMIPINGERFAELPLFIEIIAAIVALTLFISILVVSIVKKHFSPNYKYLIGFILLFATGIAGIFTVPSELFIHSVINGDGVASISLQLRIISVMQLFILLLNFYVIVCFLPIVNNGVQTSNLLAMIFMGIVLVFCVYSYITESANYIEFFKQFKEYNFKLYAVKSLFPNGNAYAIELFVGIVAATVLHNRTGKWWWLLPILFFIFNILFTSCRSIILCDAIFLISYFLYRFIYTIKKHLVINIIMIGLFILVCIGAVVIYFVVDSVKAVIDKVFELTFMPGGSIASRVRNWECAIEIFKISDWRYGSGFNIFSVTQAAYFGFEGNLLNFSCHNAYLDVLGSLGVFGCAFFLYFVGELVFKCIRLIKYDKQTAFFALILGFSMMFYSMFENGRIILPTGLEYMVLTIFVWVTVNSQYKKLVPSLKLKRKVLAE